MICFTLVLVSRILILTFLRAVPNLLADTLDIVYEPLLTAHYFSTLSIRLLVRAVLKSPWISDLSLHVEEDGEEAPQSAGRARRRPGPPLHYGKKRGTMFRSVSGFGLPPASLRTLRRLSQGSTSQAHRGGACSVEDYVLYSICVFCIVWFRDPRC